MIDTSIKTLIEVPTDFFFFSFFPSPNLKLSSAAQPFPIIKDIAVQIITRGNIILVAAFHKYPTPCPINI